MPASLAFHLLGPLQVSHGDARIRLGGPRERLRRTGWRPRPSMLLVLLAALLVEHGAVVSVDRLAQALWGERPPAAARQ